MTMGPGKTNIDLHLIRVLVTVLNERSVSRAAMKLHATQPRVSAQLKRLRHLTGDPLLVRAGPGMVPTDAALAMLEPATRLLEDADRLFARKHRATAFEPAHCTLAFRIAASDYLDPLFLPSLVQTIKREAPGAGIDLHPLSADFDYRRALASGEVDLVVGNWLQPPGELHMARLIADDVVCLVAADHPATRGGRHWTAESYLASEHVGPSSLHAGGRGVIDEHLQTLGLTRTLAVRAAHFSLIPLMVARSRLVLTTGRQFCSRYLDAAALRIVRCPVEFPPLVYYQLWHERTQTSSALRWLREQVKAVAAGLAVPSAARPGLAARARA
jgi:DNA-binding transcriptional LysR family regulator